MSSDWKGNITQLMDRVSKIATGAGNLLVLAAGSRIALALPENPVAARIVADLYQPQRWKGRVFLILAKSAIFGGFVKIHPTYKGNVQALPEVEWLKKSSAMGTVGFLGCNPNHGPRCILAGINAADGEKFIAKLGLDGSAAAVRAEAEVLERLGGRFPGVVRSMGLEVPDTSGRLNDQESDFDWALLRLPHLGTASPKSISDPEVRELLRKWLGKTTRQLGTVPWAVALLAKVVTERAPENWHPQMRSLQIRTALLHGDFAVWNLRKTEGGLTAIDWEWAEEDAVGGIDLAHAMRQECYMVRCMKPKRAVAWMLEQAASPQWRGYLEDCGWGASHVEWLRLGLLHSHFNAKNDSSELLAVLNIHL
jgi:hypothetical protein